MSFGSVDRNQSPMERSVAEMQHEVPVFNGEGKNTFEKDGKYYFMNREVSKEEYDAGIEKYNQILDHKLRLKKEQLN